MNAIVSDVYVGQMSGQSLNASQANALAAWVGAIPAPPAPSWVDAKAAAAGKVVFDRADVGCATCHSGPKYTDNTTVDVGTGAAFQGRRSSAWAGKRRSRTPAARLRLPTASAPARRRRTATCRRSPRTTSPT